MAWVLAVAAATVLTMAADKGGGKEPRQPPPQKILVLVVSTDPPMRAGFEEVIAGEMSLRGMTAVASHLLFPDLPKERGPFEAKVAEDGFDAVTISRVVGRDDKVKWKEETGTMQPEYQGMDAWGGYWFTYEQAILPGYLEKETRVRVRTDLWRVSSGAKGPAWSGTSEMVDPRTLAQAAREIGVSIVKALAKARVI
jgi:hypothetical protein